MTRYAVTGEYVTVPTAQAATLVRGLRTSATVGVMGFNRGAWLPEDVPEADLERLLRKGLIEEVSA